LRTNPIKKSQTSRYRITRITDDTQVNQKTTSSQEYQEVYSEMLKMPTKQSTAHEESRRTSPIRNTSRIIAGN